MDIFLAVVIAIVILLLYILWRYFSNLGTKLSTNTNLNSLNTTPIKIANTSVQYAYGVWIYVNSWAPGTVKSPKKTIFSRSSKTDNTRDVYGNYTTLLYLDPVSPTLYLDVAQSGATEPKPIVMTTNFPVQRWCYVAFSVNNQYVDCYIDGKLVKSVHLDKALTVPQPSDSVYIGSPQMTSDIYINRLFHWANPLTPQQVWSNYLSGNGNPFSLITNNIGMGFTFYKDNVENSTFRIF
jgi:hypothetical protein